MFVAYVTVTIVASVFTAIAAVTYLIGHDYPRAQLDMKRLPHSWMPRLGTVLAAGSVGLLAGFAVPLLGTLASVGLVLYFAGALIAHLRVGSRNLVGWAVFAVTVVAELAVSLAYHGVW
ncbi:DoxX family protein [Asanoa sp. NPDC049573]|uniref:DoxX family protein n=1 Tax=Asanoa sp. NPDC049573 TaxID=3155396 RepID=UPI00343426A0